MNGPYVVVTRVCHRAGGAANRFSRPVKVVVLDVRVSEWHASRGKVAGYVVVATGVDSRYYGPRSAYGIAMAKAQVVAANANALEKEQSNVAS